MSISRSLVLALGAGVLAASSVSAGEPGRPVYTFYGTPGLIDMPTAESAPDGELAITNGFFAGSNRTTISFQILPRLSGSFRYTRIDDWTGPGTPATFDRSFDLRFRLIDEGRALPAVAIGLQDFVGTGAYSAEYIVATKTLPRGVTVTAGLGWGRLGSFGGFANPLGVFGSSWRTRPTGYASTGGQVEAARWFRGDAAVFGGVAWQATDRLVLLAEYSSDAYVTENANRLFSRRSPLNFGAVYRVRPGVSLGAYYLYGDTVGAALTFTFDPRRPNRVPGGIGPAPVPVRVRAPGAAADISWVAQADGPAVLRANIQTLFRADGFILEALALSATGAEVRVRNTRYDSTAEAVGRVARVLTNVLPASVETFRIVPVVNGMPASAVTLKRSDLEALEHHPDGAWISYTRAAITDAAMRPGGLIRAEAAYPRFDWGLGPYGEISAFDPNNPLLFDVGLQLRARYEPLPGLVISGRLRQSLAGSFNTVTRPSDSVLPHVRSDSLLYAQRSATEIRDLTVAGYFRPGRNLYGRLTAGYLEAMYGGISAELLWKPVTSRVALGVEVNYVKQRAFDQLFGFRPYQVATGHVSAYWDMGNGFHAQVDAGRYLAGDWGATLTIDREFKNGWKVGAFATFTTVSFARFGEGSFDKGLRLTIPLSSLTGRPSPRKIAGTLRPITRDGGARVEVPGRLYEAVRGYHQQGLRDQWGRFWR